MSNLSREQIRERINSFPHWYHQIEILPGIVTPGVHASRVCLELLPLPEDCSGLRVLDIGARDGFFSFELERRGAEVLALDYIEPTETGFNIARELLGSSVPYVVDNVYNLSPSRYGQFDIVLFLGVLYHLRDPLLALDKIWSICKDEGEILVESHVIDNAFLDLKKQKLVPLSRISRKLKDIPIMQFYPGDSLNKDYTNWWGPNMACLRAMLEMANFTVEYQRLNGTRGIFKGRKANDPVLGYYREIEKSVVRPKGEYQKDNSEVLR